MNKKGFTLVELLAIIFILTILMVIVLPTVSSVINKSKEATHNVQIDYILKSAYDYSLKNGVDLPNYNETKYITLNELKSNDLLDGDVINPKTKEKFDDDLVISISNVGSNYKYDKKYSMYKGYYLYKIEHDLMKTEDFNNNKPIITIEDYGTESFVSNVDLGGAVDDPKYTATSKDGIDITNKVVKNITYKSKNVKSINTLKAGIYYINYTVVDDNGYSNILTRSIIIVDDTPPTLVVPENIAISNTETSYNLFEGASCTDNSGVCDIEINGKIEFGVKGKYIIEDIAIDPTGNTKKIKRVITVN